MASPNLPSLPMDPKPAASGWNESGQTSLPLKVAVPAEGYHRTLISCQVGCPVDTDARGYVRAIAAGRFEDAYLIARGPNPLASICGRVCGAPCEAACRRGGIPISDSEGFVVRSDRPVAIRALKRFACERAGVEVRPADEVWEAARRYVPDVSAGAEELAAILRAAAVSSLPSAGGARVAVVGSGPAGLAAAHDLALLGCSVVVFEAEKVPAGMLALGVPAYRLPRELIRREVAVIEALGVEIRCGVRIGGEISLRELRREYGAVVLAVGAKRPRLLGLPGEQGPGVLGGVDVLRAVSLGETCSLGRSVVVIGGGNVAYDVARTVMRQVAYDTARTAVRAPGERTVTLVSLETLEEMPADTVEIVEGDEEGISRLNGWGPLRIIRDSGGAVTGVDFQRCVRVYDSERRFAPEFDENQRRLVLCDTVLMATGQTTDLTFLEDGGQDVQMLRPGWPQVEPETLATTARGVFAAGDLAHGTRLLIDAVASGKKVARSVYSFLTGRSLDSNVFEFFRELPGWIREPGYELQPRVDIPVLPVSERMIDAGVQVEAGFDETEALREASRCLDCGVTPVFDGSRCILCGGCADVCPTLCLKLVSLDQITGDDTLEAAIGNSLGRGAELSGHSAILKDEDRCIRCALCVMRCPVDAIVMERVHFSTDWTAVTDPTTPSGRLR